MKISLNIQSNLIYNYEKNIFFLIFTLFSIIKCFSQNSTEIAKIGIKSTVSVLTSLSFSLCQFF